MDPADGYAGTQARDRDESADEKFLPLACRAAGWTLETLREQPANHSQKLLVAELLHAKFSIRLDWLRQQINIRSRSYCSRLLAKQSRIASNNPTVARQKQLIPKQCNIQ